MNDGNNILICPVCGKKLEYHGNSFSCECNHVFDIAKEGYVNLLTGNHKSGSLIGDNRDMAISRRKFLSGGYYDFLSDSLCDIITAKYRDDTPVITDISCGEGYYTGRFAERINGNFCGFDISKEMIKQAAKKYGDILFFVANISRIPLESNSTDVAVQICAPFCEKEFSRILKKDGMLLSVVPGKRHLYGLKEILYENPYENNEDKSSYSLLKLNDTVTVKKNITVLGSDNIDSLFRMTPYFYKTSETDRQKLQNIDRLETECEFIIRIFKNND